MKQILLAIVFLIITGCSKTENTGPSEKEIAEMTFRGSPFISNVWVYKETIFTPPLEKNKYTILEFGVNGKYKKYESYVTTPGYPSPDYVSTLNYKIDYPKLTIEGTEVNVYINANGYLEFKHEGLTYTQNTKPINR